MNRNLVMDAVGYLDEEILARYFEGGTAAAAAPAAGRRRKTSAAVRWASVAACLILVAAAAVWLFVPYGTREQAAYIHSFPMNGIFVSYQEKSDLSRFEKLMLKYRAGELYYEEDGNLYYTVRGSDNLEYLILRRPDGELRLLRFCQFFDDTGTQSEKITFGYVLENIYQVGAAGSVKEILFERVDSGKDPIYDRIPVEEVRVRDQEAIREILQSLWGLQYQNQAITPYIYPNDSAYIKGEMPLSAQTDRRLTIRMTDGAEIELHLYSMSGYISMTGVDYGKMSDEDLSRLAEIAGIDMAYHFYGLPEQEGAVGETAELPSAP